MESTASTNTVQRGGSRKGIPNKVNAEVKENFLAVFTRLGGTAAMADWARANPTEFYRLYGRMIPNRTENEHSGSVATKIVFEWMK